MIHWIARLTRMPALRSSSALMAISSVGNVLFPFLRGVLLARLLSPKEFGISITATIVMSVAELVTDIGISQLAIKSEMTESLATFHTLAVARGAILCAVLAGCGPLFGLLFHSEGAAWIYAIVGVVSLIRGFCHLEVKLLTRSYNYLPEAASILGSQTAWTVVTIASAAILRDYRAMMFGLLAYAFVYVGMTHLFARTAFRMRWDRALVRQSIAFGRPLALNGITYAIVSLGDRALTGAKISLVELAHYTALSTSAFLPRSAIGSFLNSLFLPHFINTGERGELKKVADLWFIIISVLGGTFGCAYVAVGRALTGLVFGHSYELQQTLVSLVGVLGTIRYLTCLPTPPALAFSRGGLLLRFTMLSTSGLALGAVLVFQRPSLDLLVFGMSVGEAGALFWLIVQLRRFLPATALVAFGSMTVPLVLTIACALAVYALGDLHPVAQVLICAAACAIHLGCCFGFLRVAGLNPRDLLTAMLPQRRVKPTLAPSSA